MSADSFRKLMSIIALGLGALIAFAIVAELPVWVPLLAVMLALVAANIFRRGVKEVLADERSRRVDEKATVLTYRVFTTVTALGVLLVMMLRSSLPEWAFIAGQAVAFALCALMLLHLAVIKYYSGKL
ncbi:DUF2178 domain-containing protein [Dehalogenimonas alkenigignens]|uniref:Putative membrane protein n=1 Tax=Dehalogenimonas alkenigignens TaxID=1217799 RepID=A0A0W0GHQ4_9CHLR|nr:DUF2178 domain-containing protein [Dehalogenimonas alkenigignens]KTB48089.1 putative membrane protein [Dehalogenimonas alkenigignens]